MTTRCERCPREVPPSPPFDGARRHAHKQRKLCAGCKRDVKREQSRKSAATRRAFLAQLRERA